MYLNVFVYANNENIENWVIFRQRYLKSAFILQLYANI